MPRRRADTVAAAAAADAATDAWCEETPPPKTVENAIKARATKLLQEMLPKYKHECKKAVAAVYKQACENVGVTVYVEADTGGSEKPRFGQLLMDLARAAVCKKIPLVSPVHYSRSAGGCTCGCPNNQ